MQESIDAVCSWSSIWLEPWAVGARSNDEKVESVHSGCEGAVSTVTVSAGILLAGDSELGSLLREERV